MAEDKKSKIQKELEELSWKFMVEVERIKEEAEEDFLDEIEEEEEKKEDYSEEMDSWYQGGEYGVNDMGRDRGIIFDENKLEATEVTDWHKPAKLRESFLERAVKGIGRVLLWPFKAIAFLVSNLFRGLFSIIAIFGRFIFQAVRWFFVTLWEVVVAFKYVWIYLFGEPGTGKLDPVAVRSEVDGERLGRAAWKRVAVFVVVALVLVLPLGTYLSYTKAKDIKGDVLGASKSGLSHLEQAGEAGVNFDFSSAGEQFNLAEKEFAVAQTRIDELGVVTNKLAALIPDVDAGQKLLQVARESAQIGQHLSRVASVFEGIKSQAGSDGVGMAAENEKIEWDEIEGELSLALNKAYSVAETLNEIDVSNTELEPYRPQLEALSAQMPELVGWLSSSKDMFDILLHVLGTDEPRRWMLVFQNNSELRPTGGFMGSYAIIDMEDGEIKNIQVPGGGFYDLKGSLAVSVEAPYPFQIFSPTWQPWNANWFPDWPTSAEKIMWFYDKSGGSTVDGVIAFTPNVLEDLLGLIGEVEMPEYETSVNSENFVRMAQIEVELEYDKEENQPKKFIGDLMPKILEGVMGLEDDKMLDLWQVISDSLKEKHLLVYLANDEMESKVEDFGWAGEIGETGKDYLMVVHTNVAGGKTDRVVKSSISHESEIVESGAILNTVTLTKTHEGLAEDVFEGHVNSDYVRFYVPKGSKLLDASGFDGLPEGREIQMATNEVSVDDDLARVESNLREDELGLRVTDEFDKTVFGGWMQVAPGETKSVVIKYLLPFNFTESQVKMTTEKEYTWWDLVKQYFMGKEEEQEARDDKVYSLLVQKQPGTEGDEFTSSIKVDDKWMVSDYLPRENVVLTDEGVSFSGDLETDEYYGVVLEKSAF